MYEPLDTKSFEQMDYEIRSSFCGGVLNVSVQVNYVPVDMIGTTLTVGDIA